MCIGGPFPIILERAGIPAHLEANSSENNATTLAQVFADNREGFIKATFTLGLLHFGMVSPSTTIGELRVIAKRDIIADASEIAAGNPGPERNAALFILAHP